jgi:hypothetical protein
LLLLIYSLTAALLLWLVHRFVCRLSWPALAFLFLLPFLFVGHALVANRVYAPVDKPFMSEPLSVVKGEHGIGGEPHNPVTADIFAQMIPWRHVVRESFARGEWPLWNPYILSGDILAAAAQPAPYSPFTWIAILLPAAISFTFTAAITFLVAAVCAYAFARELGCGEWAAAVGAVGWTYSAGMALYVLWPLGLCWALFPLVLLGTRRAIHDPSVRSWALLTIAFTLLILAGHGESALHIVALGAAYGVFELVCVRRNVLRAIAAAVAAGVVALLVCAIYLLPHAEAIPQTAEYAFRNVWKANARFDTTPQVLASVATDVFPFLHVRRWIEPPIPGIKAETPAIGSIILALAIYAVWRVRSKTTWFFAAIALLCLAAHAAWKPVAVLLHTLPLFDITLNERLAFGAAFFLAMLAALGVERVEEARRRRAPLDAAITLAIVLLVLAAGTFWITHTFTLDPGPRDWGKYSIHAELALLAAATIGVLAPRRPVPWLLALLLVQRAITEGGVHKSFPAKDAYPHMAIFDAMKNVREPFRIVGQGWALIPATSALYGLEDVRGYEAMTFAPYMETYRLWSVPQTVFFNRVDDLSKPFLSLLNVRFAFAHESIPPPPGWRLAAKQGEAVLYENANALERAFVPHTVKLGMPGSLAINEMALATDFRERAWLETPGNVNERANGPGRVTIKRARRGYELDATMEGDGWIVVSICDWKGWRAYIDGRRVKTQRANAAFISIHTPAGRHRVRLVYWPGSFVTGRPITLVTLVAVLVFALIRKRASKSPGLRVS